MRRFGSILVAIGCGWFALSILTFVLFILIEEITGAPPRIPRIGGTEIVGVLLYFGVTFGIYLGSWIVMALGGSLILLETLIRPNRR